MESPYRWRWRHFRTCFIISGELVGMVGLDVWRAESFSRFVDQSKSRQQLEKCGVAKG